MVGEPQQGRKAPLGGRAGEAVAAGSVDPAASKNGLAGTKCSAVALLCCLSARVLAS